MSKTIPLLCLFFLTSCSSFFYYPNSVLYSSPDKFNLKYDEIEFRARDNTELWGWYIPTINKKRKGIILHFHGNAQNMSSHFLNVGWLAKEGYDIFVFDYRGFGPSEGSPSPLGLRSDGLGAIDFVLKNYKKENEKLIIYGQSLGGAVLLDTLLSLEKEKRTEIDFLVLQSTFSSYEDIAVDKIKSNWFTWLFHPIGHLIVSEKTAPNKFLTKLPKIPTLVIHSKADKVVPFKFGKEIFDKYPGPKKFWQLDGYPHNGLFSRKSNELRKTLLTEIEGLGQDY